MITTKQKQPQGLYLVFNTGLWERFGFYTLQAIIILYMSHQLLLSDHRAYLLYAIFSAALYLTPMLGGYIADHYLGFKRSIIIGGALLTLGYMIIAINNIHAFFLGLSILICANGIFKPSISSILGTLYDGKDDPRRDGGYTLFYMGINIGSLFPPLMAGLAVRHFGWHIGFAIAAIGMLIGFLIFLFGKKRLGKHGAEPDHSPLHRHDFSHTRFNFMLYGGLLVFIGLFYLAFLHPQEVNLLFNIAAVIIIAIVFYLLFKEAPPQRRNMLASLILMAISVGFWALYNQTFMSLMLFTDRNVNKHMMGMHLTSEMIQFFNPFFIILLSPIFSWLWLKLSNFKLDPSIPMKFAIGVLFMGSGFLLLAFACFFAHHGAFVSVWWLCFSFLLQTIGELLISPIGLSMVTTLSPPKLVGMMMGVWFFAQAEAAELAGFLAKSASVPDKASAFSALNIYGHAFWQYGIFTVLLAILAFALVPFLKKMIR